MLCIPKQALLSLNTSKVALGIRVKAPAPLKEAMEVVANPAAAASTPHPLRLAIAGAPMRSKVK